MLFTKEFQEVMEAFEKIAKQIVTLGSEGLNKEPKDQWHKQYYYCDGNANNAFKLFLAGFSLGKLY